MAASVAIAEVERTERSERNIYSAHGEAEELKVIQAPPQKVTHACLRLRMRERLLPSKLFELQRKESFRLRH